MLIILGRGGMIRLETVQSLGVVEGVWIMLDGHILVAKALLSRVMEE